MSFELSKDVNPPCVFLVDWSNLKGRLDVEYNRALQGIRIESVYPTSKLRDLVSSRTGGTPRKSEPSFWEGEIPWASPKDFGSFFLEDTKDHISEPAVLDSATTLVPASSLLVVFRSGILQHSLPVAVTTRDTAINQDLKALLPIANASAEYLAVYFFIFGKRLLPLITKSGATVQSINTAQFDELEIAVPPKPVQDRVVSRLVDAFRHKLEIEAKAKALLASIDDLLLDELGIPNPPEPPNTLESRIFQTTFPSVTGQRWDPNHAKQIARFLSKCENCKYPLKKLKDFVSTVQYGISERATTDEVGVPMLRMLNLQDGGWVLDDLKYITMTDDEKKPYLVKRGDILFNRTNSKELVGKCNVVDFDGEYVFASYLMRVTLKSGAEMLPEFLVAYMASSVGRIQIDAVSRQIVGMTNINAEEVRELLIPAIDRKAQERVCRRVASIREQARSLRSQAQADLEQAKRDIEAMILGEPTESA